MTDPERCPSVDPEQGTRCDLPAEHTGSHASGIFFYDTPASEPRVIEVQQAQQCDVCGKIAELRPYGPGGAVVCYECGMENEGSARERFRASEPHDEQCPGCEHPDCHYRASEPTPSEGWPQRWKGYPDLPSLVTEPDGEWCEWEEVVELMIPRAESDARVAEAVREKDRTILNQNLMIDSIIDKAVRDQREADAKICDRDRSFRGKIIAAVIRGQGDQVTSKSKETR